LIVVDASALFELLLGPKAKEVSAWIRAEQTHTTDLAGFEILSAVRGHVRASKVTPERAAQMMRDYVDLQFTLEIWPLSDVLNERAIELRHSLTSYDATYVALAELFDCPLITADAKIARSSGHHAQVVVV
jgi:predicted nucleic acid-binding protein